MNKSILSKNAPAPIGPYSQAVLVGKTLYVSGSLGIDPSNGELGACIKCQSKLAMSNLVAILNEAGYSLNDVTKTTVYLTDMGNFQTFNEIYASFFDGTSFPARTCVEISKLPKGGLVEIDAIAYKE